MDTAKRTAPDAGSPQAKNPVPRLGSVPVFVQDQDRALAFYRDKLGFEVVNDQPLGNGTRWITVARRPGETELILYHPESFARDSATQQTLAGRVGSWTGIVFLTEDIQQAYRMMCQRGVEFDTEPEEQPWGGWEAQFDDPDGNRFHLAQRPDHL